ncbi:MAG: 2-oxoacid:acceptor oxidoreductase subunit alpha, partial [Desulfohalobiaceae bacterium]|nr:2-oxoacid:acceptor oxidoreductase subunit alpha [Desulfohalobiaceae bacterium]
MGSDTPQQRFQVRIGGEAGQGLETVGQMLAKALIRSGFGVLTTQSAMSRIRGGHNYFSLYCGADQPPAPGGPVDLLAAFTQETVDIHQDQLVEQGLLLLGEGMDHQEAGRFLQIPFSELAEKKIVYNVLALGVLAGLLGIDTEVAVSVVRDTLGSRHEDLLDQNLTALKKGQEWLQSQQIDFQALAGGPSGKDYLAVSGSQAIALGALAAGVNFCSFYPMSPATSIGVNLGGHAESAGLVVEQAEDEIAAVNMAIGATFCGARSLVPTSGGGFALMGEGVSLAGMTETPLLIVLAQRPGPATGLPTRTEQGDLELALHSGHGEFPRAILAPGSQEECFSLTARALRLSEQFQSPVILLVDQFLVDSIRSVPRFDLQALPDFGQPGESGERQDVYERFALTEDGVSPRLIPGAGQDLVVADSDEHTPDGHITEDQTVRTQMVDKRLKKMDGLRRETVPPSYQGPDRPDLLLVSWGSSQGVVQETAQMLHSESRQVATLHFSQVWPLVPEQFLQRLQQAESVIAVESNATGQFTRLLRRETGFDIAHQVLRYDGHPLTTDFILETLE